MTIFPKQFGIGFCRIGKMIWKFGTFGITDMRWFYPEDKAPIFFRRGGPVCILIGIVYSVIVFLSFTGPNPLALFRETEIYLHEKYGQSNENSRTSFQISTESEDLISYSYNGKEGKLIVKWNGELYLFTEVD